MPDEAYLPPPQRSPGFGLRAADLKLVFCCGEIRKQDFGSSDHGLLIPSDTGPKAREAAGFWRPGAVTVSVEELGHTRPSRMPDPKAPSEVQRRRGGSPEVPSELIRLGVRALRTTSPRIIANLHHQDQSAIIPIKP